MRSINKGVDMRTCVALLIFSGCAQPSSLRQDGGGGGVHRDGGLQFEEDGGSPQFQMPDLAHGDQDLSELPDLTPPPDLRLPPGADLAGALDLASTDLAHPNVENCFNDVDDDGNGKINDGCPDTITLGADVPLPAGGGSGGGAVSVHCPANQVVIAQRFYGDDWDEWMSGVAVWCSPLTLARGASAYTVTLKAPSGAYAGSFFGGGTDYSTDQSCDTSQFRVAWSVPMYVSSFVNGFFLDCGAGTLTLSATNQLSIAFTNNNDKLGFRYSGGTLVTRTCGPDQAIVGYNGRDGAWLDQLQPICAPLVVNYKP
jgi:hypothetical protein